MRLNCSSLLLFVFGIAGTSAFQVPSHHPAVTTTTLSAAYGNSRYSSDYQRAPFARGEGAYSQTGYGPGRYGSRYGRYSDRFLGDRDDPYSLEYGPRRGNRMMTRDDPYSRRYPGGSDAYINQDRIRTPLRRESTYSSGVYGSGYALAESDFYDVRRGGYANEDLRSREIIQGGNTLRTFACNSGEEVEVSLYSDGRPVDADIELWEGPDNTPQKMKVYIEDGYDRPFTVLMAAPNGPQTVAIRNTGAQEFPLAASIDSGMNVRSFMRRGMGDMINIQGGALRTFSYQTGVEEVFIHMETDGRPLSARIEILQGPTQNKQIIELYHEDGMYRPFDALIPTPGDGNVVRIVNTSPTAYPLYASVEPGY